jgi:hypothetical protein
VNRAADARLGHTASIPCARRCRSPEALALGAAVMACRRRYHCPERGCLLNRSRDCSRLVARGHCMPASLSLPLRRLPFSPCGDDFHQPTGLLVRTKLRGSAPRARQGEAPARAGADPGGLPGLPRLIGSSSPEIPARACADPLPEAALAGGRSPSARVALALATPGLADGQGRRRARCACTHESKKEIDHVCQTR